MSTAISEKSRTHMLVSADTCMILSTSIDLALFCFCFSTIIMQPAGSYMHPVVPIYELIIGSHRTNIWVVPVLV